MKTTFLTGLSLTLLMLLLVLSAAFWFLYQGRQTLEERVDGVSQDVAALTVELDENRTELLITGATRQAAVTALATAESNSVLLEGQLVGSQQLADEQAGINEALSTELADARANLAQLLQEQEAAQRRRPVVQFVAPDAGATLLRGEVVEVIAAAADPLGIAAFSLTLDQEPLQSYTVADEPLFTARKIWQPEDAGSYTINAVATNSLGLVSQLVTMTVEVIDRETRSLEMLSQIEANVSELRGLASDQPPNVLLLAPGVEADAPPAAALSVVTARPGWLPDALTLASFDLLSADTDLAQGRALLQAELGWTAHDPAQPQVVRIEADGQIAPAAEWAHVHQFIHTLQAQHHALDFNVLNALDFDARYAFYSLVEGEVALIEGLYLEQGYLSEVGASQNPVEASVDPAIQELPTYLLNEYSFPFTAGKSFVAALFEQGQNGFDLIDAAWQDPPSSSEQVLHPDRFLAGDQPRQVSLTLLTRALGSGWAQVQEGRLGEFFLRQYLGQQLSDDQVDAAATGWGGDHFAIYQNEAQDETVMALRLIWDTVEEGSEFAAIYPNYPTRLYNISGELQANGAECWQANDVICLYHMSEESYIWRAPNIEMATAIAQALDLSEQG